MVAVGGDITAELDLLLEKLSLPENYAITAYSIDGGVTWKAGTPVDKDGTVSKFLNNGGTLVLTNVYDKKIKKPGDKAVIFTFEPVAKRPKANEERLNVNYAILADNSGSTYGAWTLAVRGANSYTIDGYEVSSSSDSKKPDSDWTEFPKEGIQVSASKQVYFIRKAPVKGVVNRLASKPFKVTTLPVQKAPSIKPDYKKELIKGKAGCSIAVSGEVHTFTKADKGDALNISIVKA